MFDLDSDLAFNSSKPQYTLNDKRSGFSRMKLIESYGSESLGTSSVTIVGGSKNLQFQTINSFKPKCFKKRLVYFGGLLRCCSTIGSSGALFMCELSVCIILKMVFMEGRSSGLFRMPFCQMMSRTFGQFDMSLSRTVPSNKRLKFVLFED
jgi:hypothetical protein